MVGKRSLKSDEIRTYIKARNELKIEPKSIFNEICQVYGDNEVSYRLVRNWIAKFNSGLDSIQDASRSGRRRTAVTPKNISKISNILKSDARYTSPEIAQMTGISEASARRILKKNLGLSRKVARWIPHILTKDQLTQRVKMAKKLLKLYPKFERKGFVNIVTGDETWVHFFEPHRKIDNKIWATRHARRPVIAKRTISVKKVMLAVFFDINGPIIQVSVPKGRTVTGTLYKRKILKKLNKYFEKRRPRTGLRGVHLLHDNAPAHTSSVVTDFLKTKKVTVLPHPPYSPDLAPADFFLFPKLKRMLSGRKYGSRNAVASAVYQCLKRIPKKDYENAFRNWLKRLKLCISHNGDYFEGNKKK